MVTISDNLKAVDSMHFVEAKTLLNNWNGINVYRGCQHGCIYCDSRSDCYQFKHQFEDIEVKMNAPELLESILRSKRQKCMIGTGSMCDPYMPLENKLRLTEKCLQVIERYNFGATVITKSDLVLRDLQLFESINRKTKAVVTMTLTTYDDELCRILEPNVCVTSQRYEALKILQRHNIPTIVWLTPILPYINDTANNINGILDYCFDAGVKGIICFHRGMTLRNGSREYFYNKLDKHFPGLRAKYQQRYGDSLYVSSEQNDELMNLFHERCEANHILNTPQQCFDYLHEFPTKCEQLSLFD